MAELKTKQLAVEVKVHKQLQYLKLELEKDSLSDVIKHLLTSKKGSKK